MFKWLPCFALLRRKSGNACCNHFFLQTNNGHALPCGSSSSHALNYSLSPTCGTASIWVHQPCTKLLCSRVMVEYPDRSAAVMLNEPLNHKAPSFPAVSWTDEAAIISLFSLSFLSWMDAGAPADVMSMALAQTAEAHGTKKRKHPTETTADKLKSIAPVQAPLSGIPH